MVWGHFLGTQSVHSHRTLHTEGDPIPGGPCSVVATLKILILSLNLRFYKPNGTSLVLGTWSLSSHSDLCLAASLGGLWQPLPSPAQWWLLPSGLVGVSPPHVHPLHHISCEREHSIRKQIVKHYDKWDEEETLGESIRHPAFSSFTGPPQLRGRSWLTLSPAASPGRVSGPTLDLLSQNLHFPPRPPGDSCAHSSLRCTAPAMFPMWLIIWMLPKAFQGILKLSQVWDPQA